MKYLVIVLLLAGCGAAPNTEVRTMKLQSQTVPAQILGENPDWKAAYNNVQLNAAAVEELKNAQPAHVDVYLGVWCGDSRREVVRHFRLNETGEMPFTTTYISLGRDFGTSTDVALEAVPTFVVTRDGKELGRIVESSPTTLEEDLAGLLSGRLSGRVSASR